MFPSLLPAAYTSPLSRHRPRLSLRRRQRFATDDAVAGELLELGFRQTEQAAQDFVVVLAERAGGSPHCDGRIILAVGR